MYVYHTSDLLGLIANSWQAQLWRHRLPGASSTHQSWNLQYDRQDVVGTIWKWVGLWVQVLSYLEVVMTPLCSDVKEKYLVKPFYFQAKVTAASPGSCPQTSGGTSQWLVTEDLLNLPQLKVKKGEKLKVVNVTQRYCVAQHKNKTIGCGCTIYYLSMCGTDFYWSDVDSAKLNVKWPNYWQVKTWSATVMCTCMLLLLPQLCLSYLAAVNTDEAWLHALAINRHNELRYVQRDKD